MSTGKSLQLRNIVRPRPKMLHKSWEKVWWKHGPLAGELRGVRTFGPPYRNPERPARKAATLAKRRAAKANARKNGRRG